MSDASVDARAGASGHGTSEPTAGSIRDALEVELDPVDVWVLGQLIEAEAASFPPEIEQEIMDGYRILKLSGYTPPPAEGHTDVDLTALPEERDRARSPEPSQSPSLDTETEPLPSPPPSDDAGSAAEPPPDPEPARLEEVLETAPAEREVVLAEITTEPSQARLEALLNEHMAGTSAALADIEARLDEVLAAAPAKDAAATARPSGGRDDLTATAVDVGLIGADVLVAALFALAAAALADAVFAVLSLGLVGVALFLAAPYLVAAEEVDA